MSEVTLDGWITLGTIVATFGVLAFTRISTDLVMMAALTTLLVSGVLLPSEALVGFANEGMITVAVLYIVANGLYETGVVGLAANVMLGRPTSDRQARWRLMSPVAIFSALINNTPVVAMLVPVISSWAKRYQLHPSQLMIPLSYAAIIGGTCTLIGTSTNLILNSMLMDYTGSSGLKMFELAWIGVPCSVAVIVLMVLCGRWLLPSRSIEKRPLEELRRYTVEMKVERGSILDGVSIEAAGLRSLPHLYLISIERQGRIKAAVGPNELLRGGDHLMFVGVVESIVDLKKIRGLRTVDEGERGFADENLSRAMVEVVVSPHCPLIAKTIRDARFRTHYNAAVVAVARHGLHVNQKIGDIKLAVGDTLLLDAPENFLDQQRYSKDFLLVSTVENSQSVRHKRSFMAIGILLSMMLVVSLQILPLLHSAFIAAGLMLVTRCTTGAIARKSIDWAVLVVIAASIGLGVAVEKTGLAVIAADWLILSGGSELRWVLLEIFVMTAIATSLLSNATAAVLMFPVAMASSEALGLDSMPFVVALIMGASASFATPIGYQTNLMVYGPGGYVFSDYLRAGLPMVLLVGGLSVLLIPLIWPPM